MWNFLTAPMSLLHAIISLLVLGVFSCLMARWLRNVTSSLSTDKINFREFVNSEIQSTDQILLLIEDLIRISPERAEMLEVTRQDFLVRHSRLEEFAQVLAMSETKPVRGSLQVRRLNRRIEREDRPEG